VWSLFSLCVVAFSDGEPVSTSPENALAEIFMHKRWDEMNSDEKADYLRGELRQMSSLYAMLSSQIQEVSRSMKALQKEIDGVGTPSSQ
jgi:hypothetical protein